MVETISPVVHGGRNRSYWTSLVIHILSATITAAAFGSLLGLVGGLLDAPGDAWLIALAVVAGLYFLREAFALPIPVPQRKKQVPEWWRNFYSRPIAALLYGLGLGVGYFTYLTYGTFVAVTIGALATGDAATGALVAGPFGFARALALAGTGRTDAGRARGVVDALDGLASSKRVRALNAAALVALVAVSISAL